MKNIIAKEYSKLNTEFVGFAAIIALVLIIICGIQFITINSLRAESKTKIYVAIDGKYYQARPEQKKKRDKLDYEVFTETWAYNMFSHDINSLDERLEIAKPFIYEKGYNYILSTYGTNENAGWEDGYKNIKQLYKTRDARTYYTIDSVKINMKPKNKVVQIYGTQKAVFAVGNDVIVPLSFEAEIITADKSDLNPFGLSINKFNFIKQLK